MNPVWEARHLARFPVPPRTWRRSFPDPYESSYGWAHETGLITDREWRTLLRIRHLVTGHQAYVFVPRGKPVG